MQTQIKGMFIQYFNIFRVGGGFKKYMYII